jgi:glycogen operon protein
MTTSRPSPLGATVSDAGTQFAVVSRHATKVTLELFDAPGDLAGRRVELDAKRDRTGDVWHVFVPGVRAGQLYGWRVDGPWAPFEGLRFNAKKLLMDPYARAFSGRVDATDDAIFGHDRQARDADLRRSEKDSAHAVPRSVVVGALPRLKSPRPHTPWERTVIYEVHVGAFTSHPSAPTRNPGTYLGLIDTIPHLRRLGVTAIELLPIMDWNAQEPAGTDPITGATLYNYWGYSTLGFFAPETRFRRGCGLAG